MPVGDQAPAGKVIVDSSGVRIRGLCGQATTRTAVEDLMDSNATYVSDRWLRAYTYERGKDGDARVARGSQLRLRLAEGRATLHETAATMAPGCFRSGPSGAMRVRSRAQSSSLCRRAPAEITLSLAAARAAFSRLARRQISGGGVNGLSAHPVIRFRMRKSNTDTGRSDRLVEGWNGHRPRRLVEHELEATGVAAIQGTGPGLGFGVTVTNRNQADGTSPRHDRELYAQP